MAKEGSVAPKERVNIVFKPATGDANEQVELPLKVVMTGDYTGRQDERAIEDRKPININGDNFNDVMRSHNLELSFNVPNRLVDEPAQEMPVNLKLETLKDFSPENIAEKVPDLKKLLELREALTALKGPLGNVPAFRRKLQEMIIDDDLREKLLGELTVDEDKPET